MNFIFSIKLNQEKDIKKTMCGDFMQSGLKMKEIVIRDGT